MIENNKQTYNKYKFLPVFAVEIYVGITLFLYFFGPWKYSNENDILLLAYMIAFLVISFFFYWWGCRVKFRNISIKIFTKKDVRKIIRLALVFTVIEKTALLLSCIMQYGIFSLGNIANTLAQTYQKMYDGAFANENIIRQIDGLLSFIYIIAVCGSLFIWKEIGRKYRIITIVNIILVLIYNIGYLGVQKNIFDNVIYISVAIAIHILQNEKRQFNSKKVIVGTVIIIMAILLLSSFMSTRRTLNKMGSFGSTFDYDNILIRFLPENLKIGIGTLISYGTMGYYYFGKTISLPFRWTFGIGGAWGLNQLCTQFFGTEDMFALTYPGRLQSLTGIDTKANWLTIFPWLAGDFTLIGSLLVMGVAAYVLARCWKEVLVEKNIISYIMISRLAILYFYLLANNQLFITKGEAISTIVIVLLWMFTRNSWKYKGHFDEKIKQK